MKELITAALNVFSQERQIYFKNKRFKLAQKVEEEKAKKYPNYSKAMEMRAKKELENFDASFAVEFKTELQKLLSKAGN